MQTEGGRKGLGLLEGGLGFSLSLSFPGRGEKGKGEREREREAEVFGNKRGEREKESSAAPAEGGRKRNREITNTWRAVVVSAERLFWHQK